MRALPIQLMLLYLVDEEAAVYFADYLGVRLAAV